LRQGGRRRVTRDTIFGGEEAEERSDSGEPAVAGRWRCLQAAPAALADEEDDQGFVDLVRGDPILVQLGASETRQPFEHVGVPNYRDRGAVPVAQVGGEVGDGLVHTACFHGTDQASFGRATPHTRRLVCGVAVLFGRFSLVAVMEGEIEMDDARPFALALVASLAVGCASAPPPVAPYSPRFSYSYPPGESPASDVTIAVVRPIDVNASQANSGKTLAQSSKHMTKVENDFNAGIVAQLQELMNKKGFKQTGPFDDLNSMTFPDKKGADLTLTVQVGLSFAVPPTNSNFEQGFGNQLVGGGVAVLESKGACSGSGFISLVMLEPLSGEKIWVKKIDVPSTEVDCTGKGTPENFNVIDNGVSALLEKAFQLTMKRAWDYISPEEIAMLKKQSQELRAKKVY
jgi:hypothetical protein